jgi:hypothetical protein
MNYPAEYAHVFSLLDRVRPGAEPNRWYAACPAHDDRRPSLNILVGDDRLLIVCCGPGCSFQKIVGALSSKAGSRVWLRPHNKPPNGKELHRQIRERKLMIEAVYPYADEHGEILFEVCRGRDQEGRKQFWQRVPDDSMPGGYRLTLDGVKRVLFNLPDLHANAQLLPEKRRVVVVAEGEKDCENLSEIGVLATTNSGGAGKFGLSDYKILSGQRVFILADHDPITPAGRRVGWDHAVAVATCLHGKAAEVRIVNLPVEEGEDISDWLCRLPPSMDAKARRHALWEVCRDAPLFDPLSVNPPISLFVLEQLKALAAIRRDASASFKSPAEAVGTLEVAVHGLVSALGDAKAQGLTPDPAMLLRRLLDMAAVCQRSSEDLKLVSQLDTNRKPE